MLGLFVTGISPYISLFKRTALRSLVKRGAEGRILHIGKADVYYADLSLPLSVPDSGYQRFLDSTFRAAYERGVRQAVMPAFMEKTAGRTGISAVRDIQVLRRFAARAAISLIGGDRDCFVKIYARMPCREAVDCLYELAEKCRYVTAAGGEWAGSERRRLLRDYGAAAAPYTKGVRRITLAFDGGFSENAEIIDLTKGEGKGSWLRPRLFLAGRPDIKGYFDETLLAAALVMNRALDEKEVLVCCPPRLDTEGCS